MLPGDVIYARIVGDSSPLFRRKTILDPGHLCQSEKGMFTRNFALGLYSIVPTTTLSSERSRTIKTSRLAARTSCSLYADRKHYLPSVIEEIISHYPTYIRLVPFT